jgi:DNA-binding NarL/FixJ family response regulator
LLKRAKSRIEVKPISRGDRSHSQKDVDQVQQEVISLFEKGMSSKKIAANMGIAKGEVDLVLDLKRKFAEIEKG